MELDGGQYAGGGSRGCGQDLPCPLHPITSSGRTLKEAGLTQKDSTPFPADGTLEWVDDGGVPLPETTVEEANRTDRWRFIPADDNYPP